MWISLSTILAICCLQAIVIEGALLDLNAKLNPLSVRLNLGGLSKLLNVGGPSRQLSGDQILSLFATIPGKKPSLPKLTPPKPAPPTTTASPPTGSCDDETPVLTTSSPAPTSNPEPSTPDFCDDETPATPEPTCDDVDNSTPTESTPKPGYITYHVNDAEDVNPDWIIESKNSQQ